ncbi:hypothetical protein N7455_009907 [Penicillium solitum]|uniref:uncharacterized protein n=1 Tax=Penicillium solitum TaxID=60172 RepID=UPI0032C48607|nr:hypothetical protein N7455_009907 [Penicillium solitum]
MAIVPSPLLGELLTANRINRQAGAMSNPQTGTTDDKPSGTDKRRSTVGRGKCGRIMPWHRNFIRNINKPVNAPMMS